MQLVEHRYQDRGYREMTDAAPSLHAFANSELLTLTMSHYGDVCGTISIRFDGPHGLAADEVFPAEMRELRTSGMALCEFTKLALDIEETSRQVLAHLFHRAYLCAFRQHEAELMVIEVNPRHVAFYRRLLGFNVLSDVRMNPRVNAPAVLLSLSMVEAQQQIARYGGHGELGKVVRTLYPFSYSPQDEQALLDSLVH
ncbi:MAG: hypothetical protein JOY60_12595 [Burkholderiaceae bacterium]|nr:long-chain N-acyl amino acid synthase [Roseateles sp.]MBV8470683.1 hypothetical protein [Burkholderiaceae bacterium]